MFHGQACNGYGGLMKKKHPGLSMAGYVFLFLIGFGIYMYPFVADRWNAYVDSQMIADYQQVVVDNGPKEKYVPLFEAADEYNRSLYKLSDQMIVDNSENDAYSSLLNLGGNGIMGYIEIPKIQINVPVLHYVTDDVLEEGIGHIPSSSLPVGGEKTRCVLTGHRGMPESKLFTDLDKLKDGDLFYLHVLDRDLAYEVCDIQTVLPYELDSLKFEDGKDLVTLITCTPYGVNTHRLLVTGRRTEFDEKVKVQENEKGQVVMAQSKFTPANGLVLGMVVMMVVFVTLSVVSGIRERKRKRRVSKD